MRIIGCDLHATQQTIAMLDCESGEVVERTLKHEGNTIREFYAALPRPAVVGIEATGSMGWFLRLMAELEITCHVGHPATIRRAETRRQKHDRRDAALLLELLTQDRFPSIWMPSTELGDLRALLLHRHQWVRIRTRVMNALQGLALAHGIRRRAGLWSREGQVTIASLPLPPHAAYRRSQLQGLYVHLTEQINELDQRVRTHAAERPQAARLMTHPWGRARDRTGDRGVSRRPGTLRGRQGRDQLRRVDPERVLERRSAAARENHQARESTAAVALVRSHDPCRATRSGITPVLSAQAATERIWQGACRRGS
jgi:hypothetical protein